MKPVSPVYTQDKNSEFGFDTKQNEIIIAEHQDEYQNLPAIYTNTGTVITRWEMTPEEREKFLNDGELYLTVETFGDKLQPFMLSVEAPELAPLDVAKPNRQPSPPPEPTKSRNIIEGIQDEIKRLQTWILPEYVKLGAVGTFGKTMIEQAITEGNAAIASGDVVAMVQAYARLQGCE